MSLSVCHAEILAGGLRPTSGGSSAKKLKHLLTAWIPGSARLLCESLNSVRALLFASAWPRDTPLAILTLFQLRSMLHKVEFDFGSTIEEDRTTATVEVGGEGGRELCCCCTRWKGAPPVDFSGNNDPR